MPARRRSGLRIAGLLLALMLIGVGVFLATPAVRMTAIVLTPEAPLDSWEVERQVRAATRLNSLALLDTVAAQAALLERFPELATASVSRQWAHTATVAVTLREPLGIWCTAVPDESCSFWDASGVRWGRSVPSVGPLLVQVRDERSSSSQDATLAAGIARIVAGLPSLGLKAKRVTLPDDEPGGARIALMPVSLAGGQGYELRVDLLGDIPGQLDALGALVASQAGKPFAPLYVDVRVPGRIYYQ